MGCSTKGCVATLTLKIPINQILRHEVIDINWDLTSSDGLSDNVMGQVTKVTDQETETESVCARVNKETKAGDCQFRSGDHSSTNRPD